jgi:hypothetical protein
MVILSIFKSTTEGGKRRQTRNFTSVNDAVRYGQISGFYYEIFDTLSGTSIAWEEVNETTDDGWYYDETELIWKKQHNEVCCEAE